MTDLNLMEAGLLKQAMEDPDLKRAVSIFFNNQRQYYIEHATSLLLSGKQEEAVEAAHFAKCWETAMPELKHFIDNQLQRLSQ